MIRNLTAAVASAFGLFVIYVIVKMTMTAFNVQPLIDVLNQH